ncbi:MAG: type II secretion system GspH family protein [Gemmataceae bacterium]|nr:type II secretion system GspH family protein [Gemmataceae bacterium]MDW8267266.1 type II secretion system protein [Gemmataceae bacterium]
MASHGHGLAIPETVPRRSLAPKTRRQKGCGRTRHRLRGPELATARGLLTTARVVRWRLEAAGGEYTQFPAKREVFMMRVRREMGSRQGRRSGFTLIELVVVVLIIATLAGLAIPVVAMIGRSSDMAASAKTQADLANNIQMFFMLQKRYPQGLDSLLDTTGAIYASDTTDGNTQTRGLPYMGADGTRLQDQLTAATLTNAAGAEWLRSFSRSGFDWVYDHSLTAADSNFSTMGSPPRLTSTSPFAVAEVTGAALTAKLVPRGLQTGQRLVALGIGPRNTAVGTTIANCPIYPGCDGRYYGRYVAVFMIYATGERATLVGVIDSYGRHNDYTIQQFNQSLPDGARQG